jgi:hypothetical protein
LCGNEKVDAPPPGQHHHVISRVRLRRNSAKNKKYHIVETFQKSNRKIVEIEAKSIPLTYIYMTALFFGFDTDTSKISATLNNISVNIVAVSFCGGGNQSTRGKPSTFLQVTDKLYHILL